jgi:fimbrial chaperone protein
MSNPARFAARFAAAWMLYLAAASQAAAGNFSVSPVRVDLSAAQPTAVITVHNNDSAPLLVQAATLSWTQPSGEESYADTRDILATPTVFTLPPDGDQIVRVALRRGVDMSRELSYRILLSEVPQAAREGFTGLRVALRLSLPIFIKPSAEARADVAWQAKRNADGALLVSASNKGTAHLQITDFELLFADQPEPTKVAVTRYVLPGSTVTWNARTPPAASHATSARIRGFSSSGEFQADVSIVGP